MHDPWTDKREVKAWGGGGSRGQEAKGGASVILKKIKVSF